MTHLFAIWRWKLHWQILLGLIIGAAIGFVIGMIAVNQLPPDVDDAPAEALRIVTGFTAHMLFELIGDLFLRGLKLIVVPLVTSSIILAVANLGNSDSFGRMGIKTLTYYMVTSLIAILIGLMLMNIIRPGIGGENIGILQGRDLTAFQRDQAALEERVGGRSAGDFLDVFRQMIPENVIDAATNNGQLLGLIVVSLFIGFFLARLNNEGSRVVLQFTQGVYDVTMRITDLVLTMAPIGILGLLAATISEQYAKLAPDARFDDFIVGIVTFAVATFGALMLHLLVVMPLILLLVARVNPLQHYKAMAPALVTAFSTASSSATLPVTMECVEERAGVSRKTASFVLPLGATVNMDGTAIYECAAAIFICQAFGVQLSFAQQFMIVIVALLTSVGVAGVPAASLVAIVVILNAVEAGLEPGMLPEGVSLVSGLALLMVFDRPLDMCRTAVNIFSDSVGAVVIARTEGETDVLRDEPNEATMPRRQHVSTDND